MTTASTPLFDVLESTLQPDGTAGVLADHADGLITHTDHNSSGEAVRLAVILACTRTEIDRVAVVLPRSATR